MKPTFAKLSLLSTLLLTANVHAIETDFYGEMGIGGRTFFDGDIRWLKHYGFQPLEAASMIRGLTP